MPGFPIVLASLKPPARFSGQAHARLELLNLGTQIPRMFGVGHEMPVAVYADDPTRQRKVILLGVSGSKPHCFSCAEVVHLTYELLRALRRGVAYYGTRHRHLHGHIELFT